MSSWSAVPPTWFAIAARSAPCAGTSRQMTCAPSRASTSAIAAPMPRDAPVTTATLPSSGAPSRRARRDRLADADHLAGRRRPSGPRAGSAASTRGCPRRRARRTAAGAVAPGAISLPAERTKPSSARCATASGRRRRRAAWRARSAGRSARSGGCGRGRTRRPRAGPRCSRCRVASTGSARRSRPRGRARSRDRRPRGARAGRDPGLGADRASTRAAARRAGRRSTSSAGPAGPARRAWRRSRPGGEAEPAHHEPARRGVGELLVAVGHGRYPVPVHR